MSIRNFVRVYRQVMMFSGSVSFVDSISSIRFEVLRWIYRSFTPLNVPENKDLLAHPYVEGATAPSDKVYHAFKHMMSHM